jgi:hypothetical protein
MKTHVLIISETFPGQHWKQGKATHFQKSMEVGTKIHTLRKNPSYWFPRIEQVKRGEAVLSVRKWNGTPYKTKQTELFRFDYRDHLGFELIQFENIQDQQAKINNVKKVDCFNDLAANDGLSLYDFQQWFTGTPPGEVMAIIHFTPFRYAPGSEAPRLLMPGDQMELFDVNGVEG